jgi:hypothetical protein
MQESFDWIVRDWDALLRYRAHIARNPEKAQLRKGEFILFRSKKLQNIDFQSVRPTDLQPAGQNAAENLSPGRTGRMPVFHPSNRTRLIIGDQAIRFRQEHAGAFRFWDLGEQWKKLTGLPFVYALWLIRPEVPDPKSIAQRLRELRDENLADIAAIVSDAVADAAHNKQTITQEFLDRYYHEYLRFGFGAREKQGLQTFADLCAKHGVLPKLGRDFSLV